MHDGHDGLATFDVRFHTGHRLYITASTATLTDHTGRILGTAPRAAVAGGRPTAVDGEEDALPLDVLDHAREALNTALHVSRLHTSEFGSDATFPVVVGGRDREATSAVGLSHRKGGGVAPQPSLTCATFVRTAGWALMLESGETWLLRPDGGQLLLSARADRLVCVDADEGTPTRCFDIVGSPAAPRGTPEANAVAAAADALAAVSNKRRFHPTATLEAGLGELLDRLKVVQQ